MLERAVLSECDMSVYRFNRLHCDSLVQINDIFLKFRLWIQRKINEVYTVGLVVDHYRHDHHLNYVNQLIFHLGYFEE